LLARSGAVNACVTLKTPSRLVAITACQSLATVSGSAVKGLRRVMPALFTRMDTWPNCLATSAATVRQAARSLTSRVKACALPPASRIAFAVSAAGSPLMSSVATVAPSRA
jgi:hypothetical protein